MTELDIARAARERLAAAFGSRLRGVHLFGSRAGGAAQPDSDMDLLVLLEGPVKLARDIDRAVAAIYPLQLEVDFPIHPMPVDVEDFEGQEFALYRSVRKEGVPL
jgi:predicted nucleotidyltransferase